ncbi:MAG TPA: hypothetical protein VLY04_26135 [Bryobacteraceae bacterium]|nr:hypothetical protein [Bryobacteraceae bacterium]
MRPSRILLGIVAVLNLNCGRLPAQKGDPGMPESPWELRLSVSEGLNLRATLHNRTKVPQTYLRPSKIQPLELILTAPSGERVAGFDTRAKAKFDNTVYREMYRQAAPGSDVTLTEASLDPDHTLRWGPFLFANLPAGTYHAQAVWRSETNQYYDPKSKRTGVVKDVWIGTVTSNTVEFSVQ